MKRKWIIPVVLALFCMGCGYHFAPGGENVDAGIQKIFIGAFSNSTSEANVENYVRNAFFSRFRRGSRFTPVASMDEADASLTGKIVGITTSHLAYSSSDLAKEDRVEMALEVVFKRTDNGEVIWMNAGLSGREAYAVAVSTTTTATNKENAIKKLSVDMADKAYRNMLSGF
ncbi:MAG: LPS assembly lipoprotein LptE [Syntrophales bacterium]|nr:LPS assembly lipoprotein LptE [Syntrophales bacterium]